MGQENEGEKKEGNDMLQNTTDQLSKYQVNYSNDELKDYWQHFKKAYPDGKLTRTEFIDENIKQRGGRREVWEKVYDLIDDDGNGYVDFQEYMIFLATLDQSKSSSELLNSTFDLVDLDGNGVLDKEELSWIVKVIAKEKNLKNKENYGDNFQEIDVKEYSERLFKVMDEDGNGVVDRDEFMNTCLKDAEIREILTTPLNQMQHLLSDKSLETQNAKTFEDQVGGHGSTKKDVIKKTIIMKEDIIMKPLDEREFEFYEKVNNLKDPILEFMPKYYGRDRIDHSDGESVYYIKMENCTYGMHKPCIIDAKMGTRGYDEKASTRKVLQQKVLQNFTLSGTLGFRLCGVKVYKKKIDDFYSLNKHKAGRLPLNKIEDTFVNFVNNGLMIRRELARSGYEKLQKILEYFKNHQKFKFYSSSLLFIYDGADETNNDMKIVMVDFAHVDEKEGSSDEGYIQGLRCLMKLFDSIAKGEVLEKNWYHFKKEGEENQEIQQTEEVKKEEEQQQQQENVPTEEKKEEPAKMESEQQQQQQQEPKIEEVKPAEEEPKKETEQEQPPQEQPPQEQPPQEQPTSEEGPKPVEEEPKKEESSEVNQAQPTEQQAQQQPAEQQPKAEEEKKENEKDLKTASSSVYYKNAGELKIETFHQFLQPEETILFYGRILKFRGFSRKRRVLVLTDLPRFFYVDEKKMTLMGEILIDEKTKLRVKGGKFFIDIPKRSYKMESKDGKINGWVKEVHELLDDLPKYLKKKAERDAKKKEEEEKKRKEEEERKKKEIDERKLKAQQEAEKLEQEKQQQEEENPKQEMNAENPAAEGVKGENTEPVVANPEVQQPEGVPQPQNGEQRQEQPQVDNVNGEGSIVDEDKMEEVAL